MRLVEASSHLAARRCVRSALTAVHSAVPVHLRPRLCSQHDDSRPRSLVLTKAELDKACKDVHHKLYADTFRIELIFTSP